MRIDETPDHTSTATSSGISRRTVVQGAAWSLPVIAVAVATPLAAASTAQSDLDISYFETAPQEGASQWDTGTVEPGYFENKPMTSHIEVLSHAPGGTVQTFTMDVQMHASSYKNDTLEIVAPSDAGWSIAGIEPTANTTVTFHLVWVGTLDPGQSVPLWLHYATAGNPPVDPTRIVQIAAITSVPGGDRFPDNNSQTGTPSYWVKHS